MSLVTIISKQLPFSHQIYYVDLDFVVNFELVLTFQIESFKYMRQSIQEGSRKIYKRQPLHITSKFLKGAFHKFYLIHF